MAARRHWRFVVRDKYGYVVQNAQVFVYLPGTTTVFAGTAYDAASGGTPVTNPFTTNDQGEVEAWFDTAQVVDVKVTDNSNTAYRAVGGVSDTLDFSDFTEKDDIYVSASDGGNEKGTAADLQDITAGAQTEAVGASNRWADGAHIHGHSALSANPHGPTDHTDVTRKLWFPVLDVVNDGGTVATRGTMPNALRVLTLADAATSGMSWAFALPADYVTNGSLTFEIYHAGQTTTTGSVRWEINMHVAAEGVSVVTTQGAAAFTGQAPTTADLLVIEAASALGVTGAAGDLIRFNVRRIGADAADTYAASTSLIGVMVSYSANQ